MQEQGIRKRTTTAAATTKQSKKKQRQRTKIVQFRGDEADVGSCQRIWKDMPGIVEDPQSSKFCDKHTSLLALKLIKHFSKQGGIRYCKMEYLKQDKVQSIISQL